MRNCQRASRGGGGGGGEVRARAREGRGGGRTTSISSRAEQLPWWHDGMARQAEPAEPEPNPNPDPYPKPTPNPQAQLRPNAKNLLPFHQHGPRLEAMAPKARPRDGLACQTGPPTQQALERQHPANLP